MEKLVYIISNPAWPGWYKVGVASNWKNRLGSYQTSSPFRDYKLEYGITTEDWKEVERTMHNRYPGDHEWVQADLEALKESLKSITQK